jgi:hypothetical protein
MPVANAPGISGPDDVGMLQLANRSHLSLESGYGAFVARAGKRQDFDCNQLLQFAVKGLVDSSHATRPQFGKELVLSQLPRLLGQGSSSTAGGIDWSGLRVGSYSNVPFSVLPSEDEATPIAAIARATGLNRPTVYSVLAEGNDH